MAFSVPPLPMTGAQLHTALTNIRQSAVLSVSSIAELSLLDTIEEGHVVELPQGQFDIIAGGTLTPNATTVFDLPVSGLQACLRQGQALNNVTDLAADTRTLEYFGSNHHVTLSDGTNYTILPDTDTDPDLVTGGGVKMAMISTWNNTQRPEDLGGIDTSENYSDADRAAAIQLLVKRASERNHQVLIPKAPVPWTVNAPLNLYDGTTLNIDGVLENTSTQTVRQNLFQFGNHHPAYWHSDNSGITWYRCPGVGISETVILESGTNRSAAFSNLSVGDRVLLRSEASWLGAGDHERPLYAMMANIKAIDELTGQITLDRGVPENYGDCLIGRANDPSVITLLGEDLFASQGVRIFGAGKLVSPRSIFERGGFMDAHVDIAEIDAGNVFFSNMIQDSRIQADKITVRDKLLDCAGNSLRSRFQAGSVIVEGAGSGKALAAMNENSAFCELHINDLFAPEWQSTGGNLKFLHSRYCSYVIGAAIMPKAVSSFCVFQNSLHDSKPMTIGNTLTVQKNVMLGDTISRFIYESNTGGEAAHNTIRGGTYYGTPSTGYAIELGGSYSVAENAQFMSGALRTNSTSLGLKIANCYFADGTSFLTSRKEFDIQALTSESFRLLRQSEQKLEAGDVSTDTVAQSSVLDSQFPAGSLKPGDEISIKVSGQITEGESPGEKTIRITDDSGPLATLIFSAGEEDAYFDIELQINIKSKAAYTIMSNAWKNTVCVHRQSTSRTGLDLDNLGRAFKIERWVENDQDEIRTDYAHIVPFRAGHA